MEDNQELSLAGLTGSQLKWIAIITMLIDHIGASLLEWYNVFLPAGDTKKLLGNLDTVIRGVGRLAFPLFIFLMVEGFFYTRSRSKYLLRMSLFAAISEFPFDLAFYLRWSDFGKNIWWRTRHQNVFFTLAIGFLAIWVMESLRPKKWEWGRFLPAAENLLRMAVCAGAAWGGCRLADYLHTDYSWKGVLAIVLAYLIRLWGRLDLEIFGILAALLFSSGLELTAIADYWLIRHYNGQKGITVNRWFFYLFYPCHLLILGLLRVFFILPR